jgi:Na+-transporting methylmalonyl-CoA/oxaloacetate decarboxylase gamma subunit
LIDEKSTNLMWAHLIAFLVLFVTHLADLMSNSFEQEKEKEKEKEKKNKIQPDSVAQNESTA